MGSERHVLLADDEPGFRFAASVALRAAGYRVTVARDGREATDLAVEARESGNPVQLLVTDQQMPGMTGTELIAALRDRGVDVPVVLVTGCGDPPSDPAFRGGGFHGFIGKPLVPGDLVACLRRIFGASQEEAA